jgi:adenine phosphoribosyltransferase
MFRFEGMKNLESLIKTYNDFPRKGIAFKDILGIIQDTEVFRELILKMSSNNVIKSSEAIISIEARGFIFGSAISLQASKPMLVARKPGKLPGELIDENYLLEYGESTLSIQKESLKKFSSYAIVDDLLATGGTVECVANLIRKSGKDVCGLITVVELKELGGRSRFEFPVESIISL